MIEITYDDYDALDALFQEIRATTGNSVPSVETLRAEFFPNVLTDPFALPYLLYLDQHADRTPETKDARKAINDFIRRNVALVDELPVTAQPEGGPPQDALRAAQGADAGVAE